MDANRSEMDISPSVSEEDDEEEQAESKSNQALVAPINTSVAAMNPGNCSEEIKKCNATHQLTFSEEGPSTSLVTSTSMSMENDGGFTKKLKTMRKEDECGTIDNYQPGPSTNSAAGEVEMGILGDKDLSSQIMKGEESGDVEMKKLGPSAGKYRPNRVETEMEQVLNYNYFSPGLMDVWPEILDKLTEPADVFAMMNASPVLNSLTEIRNLKTKALFPLVIPILMKNQQLARETVLNCRLVNKWTKNSIDEAIYQQQPRWVKNSCFTYMERIQKFNARAEGFVGNPFINKTARVELNDSEEEIFRPVLGILQRFGHELRTLKLELVFNEPLPFMELLIQSMNCIPNIQRLTISFPLDQPDDQIWHDFQIQPNTFPALEGLKVLEVNSWWITSVRVLPLIVLPLLQAYGKQLKTLKLGFFVFGGDQWEPFRCPNLTKLEVDFEGICGGHAEIYNNMKELDCPQLKTLTLRCFCEIKFTAETVLVFNAFRDSLVELYIDGRVRLGDILEVDPMVIQEFPKLVQLTMDINDVSSKLWDLFRTLFPNLQDLRFLKQSYESEQLLSVVERRRFFASFPRLKRITLMKEYGDFDLGSTIVFGREY